MCFNNMLALKSFLRNLFSNYELLMALITILIIVITIYLYYVIIIIVIVMII